MTSWLISKLIKLVLVSILVISRIPVQANPGNLGKFANSHDGPNKSELQSYNLLLDDPKLNPMPSDHSMHFVPAGVNGIRDKPIHLRYPIQNPVPSYSVPPRLPLQPVDLKKPMSLNSRLGEKEYDPFYFGTPVASGSGIRRRRNSKFLEFNRVGYYDDDAVYSNQLFNKDVHYFRRKDGSRERGGSIYDGHMTRLRPGTIIYNSRERVGGSHPRRHLYNGHVRGHRPFSSASNHFNSYEKPSAYEYHHHGNGYRPTYGRIRGRHRGDGHDGWTVQVGTQLHVFDDGRERFPTRYYVQNEKPNTIRQYPY